MRSAYEPGRARAVAPWWLCTRYAPIVKMVLYETVLSRVYLLRGLKLKGLDDTGMSDPYVKIRLGKAVIDDRKK